ncbi:MAG: hypothetical protein WEB58_10285 [Planctomycetaceae bacterium]
MRKYASSAVTFALGVVCTIYATSTSQRQVTEARDAPQNRARDDSLQDVRSDIAQLNDKAPDQAHAMASVAYHFNNMWFAADAQNWPLAEFYWNETRSHMRWAVRIIPVRKDNAGQEVKLQNILEAVENSPLKQLREAIDTKDHEKFVAAYRFTMESCYSCHKASDKPYLRPRIPDRPAEPTINFDPQAEWPK